MEPSSERRSPDSRPGRRLWLAWTLALLGGLAVIGAVALALWHPCLKDGRTLLTSGCAGTTAANWVLGLTGAGTLLAVAGGLAAAVLTVRRRPGHADRQRTAGGHAPGDRVEGDRADDRGPES